MIVAMDIETESIQNNWVLGVKRIWVVVAKPVEGGDVVIFRNLDTDPIAAAQFKAYCKTVTKFVFHNGLQFDVPVINNILGEQVIDPKKVIDTLVVSRLVDYNIEGGHSLDAWGKRIGLFKGVFKDFDNGWSQEMEDYCVNDVEVTVKLFKKFKHVLTDKAWWKALRTEHDIQWLCWVMHVDGFTFDGDKAEELLVEILDRMDELHDQFAEDFPPVLVEDKRIRYRLKTDGTLYSNVVKAIESYPRTYKDGEELVCLQWQEFSPASPKQRIDRLWDAGWSPFEKTKGHIKFERDAYQGLSDPDKEAHYKKYGWTCSEANLGTLPEDAPRGAKALAEWLTLDGRRSSLVEWLGCLKPTGRIHGRFTHIGAWTGRLAHSAPNEANIPAAFHGTVKSPVDAVKDRYDGVFRSLWTTEEGEWLVGTDAEGIQLRILADLMESQPYVDAIIYGKKEDETDIHNLNKKALSLSHITRDDAKTFIYAFLLGAGNGKIAQILRCSPQQAAQSVNNFMESIEGLAKLKRNVIPKIAERGYFRGYDGRKVPVPSEHHTLAGMLQNGESTIMKYAALRWTDEAKRLGFNYRLCTWPHDEWQTAIKGTKEEAEHLGLIQRQSIEWAGTELGLMCPLAGSTDIGKNWLDTH